MASPRPSRKSDPVRLNKYLADGGLGSRRTCEDLIRQGSVRLNGNPVTDLATRVTPGLDRVEVHGRAVSSESLSYILLNKPRGVICSSRDPENRRTCLSLLPRQDVRLYTVGRLDADSQGLILLTNDGALAHRLMHPRFQVEKVYRVTLDQSLSATDRERILSGVNSRGETLRAASLRPRKYTGEHPVYEVRLSEGKNRHIRRMMEAVGRETLKLVRVVLGPLTLETLPSGRSRALTPYEVRQLYTLTGLDFPGEG